MTSTRWITRTARVARYRLSRIPVVRERSLSRLRSQPRLGPMTHSWTRRRTATCTTCPRPGRATSSRGSTRARPSRRWSWVRRAVSASTTRRHRNRRRSAVRTAWTSFTTGWSISYARRSRSATPRRRMRHAHESRTLSISHHRSNDLQQTPTRRQAHRVPAWRLWSDSFDWWRWRTPRGSPRTKTTSSATRNLFWSERSAEPCLSYEHGPRHRLNAMMQPFFRIMEKNLISWKSCPKQQYQKTGSTPTACAFLLIVCYHFASNSKYLSTVVIQVKCGQWKLGRIICAEAFELY